MKQPLKLLIIILSCLALLVSIILFILPPKTNVPSKSENNTTSNNQNSYLDNSVLNGMPLADNLAVYEQDDPSSIKYLYVTALPTIDEETGETYTIDDINELDGYYENYNPEINIIFQEGDVNGPYSDIFTPESTQGNAIMRARGFSSRENPQKSFKIKLNNNTELFLNQSVLNLNKHYADKLRITNKLCFDLFVGIPNITSMRTQFINLRIKDESKGSNAPYENYGLFTIIEQPNKKFLSSHLLDKNASLYKAEYFSFVSMPELKNVDDPEYDAAAFERILEIKNGKDHAKLLNMITDVEDISLNINDVINEHFNRDNYLTWMALNIILGNVDVTASNYLLYSPLNSKTWYFLPWDYDKTMYYTQRSRILWNDYPETQYGLGLLWGIPIHRRFFSDPQNVADLSAKIDELRNEYITPTRISKLTASYKEAISSQITTLPDIQYLSLSIDEIFSTIDSLDSIVEENIDFYYKNLESPMPIYMAYPEFLADNNILFSWDMAHDLQGDPVTYQLEVARDMDFNYIVFSVSDLIDTQYTLTESLPADKYYFRVISSDDLGHIQYPLEDCVGEDGLSHRGFLSFEVK